VVLGGTKSIHPRHDTEGSLNRNRLSPPAIFILILGDGDRYFHFQDAARLEGEQGGQA